MSPLTKRAAVAPMGPNSGAPPRSILTVKSHPDAVGLTVILSPYLVPPTPLPVTANSVGASSSFTVQVTRLRMPLTPATPTSVVPTSSSSGRSDRQPSCMASHSPSVEKFDACAHASSGVIERLRESSSLAICESYSVAIAANRRSIAASGINPLTSVFRRSEGTRRAHGSNEEGIKMKKFGFASIAATGLAAAILGFAAPAQADVIHHRWVHEIQQQVNVPQVDMTVQHSR